MTGEDPEIHRSLLSQLHSQFSPQELSVEEARQGPATYHLSLLKLLQDLFNIRHKCSRFVWETHVLQNCKQVQFEQEIHGQCLGCYLQQNQPSLTSSNLLLSPATLPGLQPTASLPLIFCPGIYKLVRFRYLNHLHAINHLLCKCTHTSSGTEGIQYERDSIFHISHHYYFSSSINLCRHPVYTIPVPQLVLCTLFWSPCNSAVVKHHKNLSNHEPKLSCNDKSPH